MEEAQKLSQPEDFDYLHRIGDRYAQIRRYAPALLESLRLKAAPAVQDILKAVEILMASNASNAAQGSTHRLRQETLGEPG